MAKAGYNCTTEGAVSLVAQTAKSVIGLKSAADFGLDLKKIKLSFGGVTASNEPGLVELCYSTFATNSPGTNSTSVTPLQGYGRVLTHGVTAAKNWTTEPTALSVLEQWSITPNGGTALYDYPLGDTYDSAFSQGFVVRCTFDDAVAGVYCTLVWERC